MELLLDEVVLLVMGDHREMKESELQEMVRLQEENDLHEMLLLQNESITDPVLLVLSKKAILCEPEYFMKNDMRRSDDQAQGILDLKSQEMEEDLEVPMLQHEILQVEGSNILV